MNKSDILIENLYECNQHDIVDGLNEIFTSVDQLIGIYDTVLHYCRGQFSFVSTAAILAMDIDNKN